MNYLNETDRFLLETKCAILKRNSRCPDGFSYRINRKNDYIFITLKCVTADGEVFQKDIYLSNLLRMNEKSLKRYAQSYLN